MHKLKGIYGIAYSCSNSNINYCDDWYTSNYKNIFDPDKNIFKKSLLDIKNLGFNNIRTYYLNPDLNHSDFLNTCNKLNLSLEIGISNDLIENRNINAIQKLINEVKNYKCVSIYTIGNEYFGSIENIIFCLNLIYSIDPNKFYMHSSIFDFEFQTAKNIYLKVPDYIKSKYIVGINMYFYSNQPNTHGDVIQNILKEYYNDDILKNSFLLISEYGYYSDNNNNQSIALWNFLWGNKECLNKYDNYLGFELFSYSDESWKGHINNENKYGIVYENGEPKESFYKIKEFFNIIK